MGGTHRTADPLAVVAKLLERVDHALPERRTTSPAHRTPSSLGSVATAPPRAMPRTNEGSLTGPRASAWCPGCSASDAAAIGGWPRMSAEGWARGGPYPSRRQSATTARAPNDHARVCLAAPPPASTTLPVPSTRASHDGRLATTMQVADQVGRVHASSTGERVPLEVRGLGTVPATCNLLR